MIKYFILSLMNEERSAIVLKNIKKFPQFEIFLSVDGYNKRKTIDSYRLTKLEYHRLDFDTYGTLANFITKYSVLVYQINHNIPYMCFIEDDLLLKNNFISFIEQKTIPLFSSHDINMIRLDDWGEGYVTSINGAKNIVANIDKTGIVANIDNQLKFFCGNELRVYGAPWELLIKTNDGDCLKTESITLL